MLYILLIYFKFFPELSFPMFVYIMSDFPFLKLILFFSCNLKGKFNDLGMARGRYIKSSEKKLSISVMSTRGGGKSSNISIFHCSITPSSGSNLKIRQFIFPCSGTRHVLSQRISNPAHSFTIQASCWSLRTPARSLRSGNFGPAHILWKLEICKTSAFFFCT